MIRWLLIAGFVIASGASAQAEYTAADRAYSNGDIDGALRAYEMQAVEGSGEALYTLGVIYARGVDVARDLVTAYKWWCLAAQTGTKHAGRRARGIARPMTHEQIREAEDLAKRWLAEHPQGVEFQSCYDRG